MTHAGLSSLIIADKNYSYSARVRFSLLLRFAYFIFRGKVIRLYNYFYDEKIDCMTYQSLTK